MSHSRVTLSKRLMQTFSNQNNLPRLPIPPLKESLNYYLQSVQAIQGNQESIQKTAANIDAFFPVGTKLRDLLSRYDKQQPNSWLERIWLDKAYNIWRVPIAINVNWWTQFQDVKSDSEDPQSNRAAALTHGLLQMNNLINKQLLPPEQTKNGQFMCMNQLKCVFQAYRTPLNPIDETRTIWPTTSDYIVVLVKNQIYKLPVHPSLSISDLKADFINILKYSIDKVQPHVGIFTAGDRGEWAKLYKDLSKNDTNKLSLATIKNALFAVALDDHTSDNKITALHHIFHNFGQNRWFDLGLTIVLDKNGRAGCNGEHSPCDAIVPANMFDYILKHEKTANVQPTQKTPNFKHLEFDFDDSASISKATENTRNYCSQIQVELLHFSDYGADFIKSSAKASPDAFVQLVLQLSYYKTHLQVEATYESASTRLFKHGRTETCRSASKEMVEFVSNFYDKPVTERWSTAEKPLQAHVQQLSRCSQGYGIDRLFLGLREMALIHKDELTIDEQAIITKFYQDANFTKSNTFILSTSNVSPGTQHYGGFGPVAVNGYGVNYSIAGDQLKFSISGWKGTSADVALFKSNLKEALEDVKEAILNK